MVKVALLGLFLSIFSFNLAGTSRIKETCKTCREIVANFKKGLDKTAKDHFGGGDTAWEESRLGSFARSETRLLEILEKVCEGTGKESRCHAIVEEYEEKIEEYWFNKHSEIDKLEDYLCIDTIQACCPEGKYGKECKDCPGGSEKPCNGHGKCKGSGTREEKGKCECDNEYQGDICDECSDKYYDAGNKTCLACDESCESSCSDGTNKGCDSCKDGYAEDQDGACVDKNECDEDDICVEGKFCINTKGSYRCNDCDPACDSGCTGTGRLSCNKCKNGWKELEGGKGCEDVDECKQADICSPGTYCVNKEGHHECTSCHASCSPTEGCIGEGPAQCKGCAPGWEMGEEGGCIDVDECVKNDIKCKSGEVCVNKEGGDRCEACHPSCNECVGTGANSCLNCRDGYLFKDSKCEDINECSTNPCDKKTENCSNTPGSYSCKCKKGFVRTKKGLCKKKTKKSKKGTKKSQSKIWQDQLYDDILSGKAFVTEEQIRFVGIAHALLFAIFLVLFKHSKYRLLAVLAAIYAVAISYLYTNYGKKFHY